MNKIMRLIAVVFAIGVTLFCFSDAGAWGDSVGSVGANNNMPAGGGNSFQKPSAQASKGVSIPIKSSSFSIANTGNWKLSGSSNFDKVFISPIDNNNYAIAYNTLNFQNTAGKNIDCKTAFLEDKSLLFSSNQRGSSILDLVQFTGSDVLKGTFAFNSDPGSGNPVLNYQGEGNSAAIGYDDTGAISKITVEGSAADGSGYTHELGINREVSDEFSGVTVKIDSGNKVQFSSWSSDLSKLSQFALVEGEGSLQLYDRKEGSYSTVPWQDTQKGNLQAVNFKEDGTFDFTYVDANNKQTISTPQAFITPASQGGAAAEPWSATKWLSQAITGSESVPTMVAYTDQETGKQEWRLQDTQTSTRWENAKQWWEDNVGGGNPTRAQQAAVGVALAASLFPEVGMYSLFCDDTLYMESIGYSAEVIDAEFVSIMEFATYFVPATKVTTIGSGVLIDKADKFIKSYGEDSE